MEHKQKETREGKRLHKKEREASALIRAKREGTRVMLPLLEARVLVRMPVKTLYRDHTKTGTISIG